ncbi:hypothetical protein E1287_10505 [Actinomadura sp. KC06]|uniref:hypothetical protein n=1 Tax=Actinomadura sp. KC06 TaxID=2530369 RepID=UPI001043E1B4|nr:hypothetical protein [Actinomadura sp. KC06]TDD36587.1 hypothetical protein E1287_10505 [Actinomadura sp. KC06]
MVESPAAFGAAPFAAQFNRAYHVAVVVTVAGWQVIAAGTALVAHFDRFRSPGAAVAVWALQLLLIAAGGVLLLRGRRDARTAWPLVAADLATGAAMAANCPAGLQLNINWAWTTVGLIAVLLLLRRPILELAAVLALSALIVLTALVLTGDGDRHNAAGFVALLFGTASAPFAIMGGAWLCRRSGGMMAEAAAEQWEIATRETVIAETAALRAERYREVREHVETILRGLADGTADPADPALWHRCAIAEATLRRLLSEREDVPYPLMSALQPGIDAAVRRGVVVDLAPVGGLPRLTEEAGAALAEIPLAALASARRYARVTVVSVGRGSVSVSVLADGDPALPANKADGVVVSTDRDGDMLWLEVRWDGP